MLLFLLLWSLLFAVCLPVGLTLLNWIGPKHPKRYGDRFVLAEWLGVIVLSNGALALSLFGPLSFGRSLALIAFLALVALSFRSTRSQIQALFTCLTPSLLGGMAVLGIGVAILTTQQVILYDTGVYHYQEMQWLSKVGAVPGLALLHIRFGYASSWLALASIFNSGRLEGRTSALMGGFALLLAAGHAVICLYRCIKDNYLAQDLLIIAAYALVLPIVIYWFMQSSPSPDFPLAILIVMVAWSLIETDACRDSLVPLVLALGAVSIKSSALPLLVVAGACYFYRNGIGMRQIAKVVAATVLFLAPMVGYQIIVSGYPFFPISAGRLSLPWTLAKSETDLLSREIMVSARWGNVFPIPPDAGGLDWIWRRWLIFPTTYRSKLLIGSVLFLVAGVVISRFSRIRTVGRALLWIGTACFSFILMFRAPNLLMVCVIILALLSNQSRFANKNVLLLMALLGIALILLRAPSLRFGIGYAAVLCAIVAFPYLERALAAFKRKRYVFGISPVQLFAVTGIVLALCRPALRTERIEARVPETKSEAFGLFLPAPLPSVAVESRQVNNVIYFVPVKGPQCWAAPLGCTPGGIQRDWFDWFPADILLRDPANGMASGFARANPKN
jgi:hypothetical protein